MRWTDEQEAILEHPLDAHAVVRAAPGSGKTTTLVARVRRLLDRGVDPARIRVVMFNKSIQATFAERLGTDRVRVTTFDALGYEVLRAADRRGLLTRRLQVQAEATAEWARAVFRDHFDDFESADEIATAVSFWKAHLVPPARAAFPSNPAFVDAFREFEALRLAGDTLRVAFEDMVYTAVGVLGRHPRLLGPVEHVLVDEFQDVNPARVELIRRLSGPETAVMAVGDEDQGINEWCGAHPRFLADFAAHFPSLPTRCYTLSRSFRFGPTLAGAANRLIVHNTRSGAAVVGGGATPGEVRETKDPGATVRSLVAEGVAPADIAVLYRGRSQGAAVLAAMVIDGVPVRTEDGSLLRVGRGPELAVATLEAATREGPVRFEQAWPVVFAPDRYVQKEAFAKQVAAVGGRGLIYLLRDRRTAEQAGQNRKAITSMVDLAYTLEAMRRAPDAGRALDRLLVDVDIEDQLRGRIRAEAELDLAITAFHAVHALLRGLRVPVAEARAALEALDPSRGQPAASCVWASTIHKAKGLEWRHVVLPGLLEGACPAEQRGSVPGTLEEPGGVAQSPWMEQERRIFYVGLTRAIEVAHLHVEEPPSRFVAELHGRVAQARKAASQRSIVATLTHQELAPAATGRRWTPEEDEALEDGWEAGRSAAELATELDRSVGAIAARLVRLGVVESRDEARRGSPRTDT